MPVRLLSTLVTRPFATATWRDTGYLVLGAATGAIAFSVLLVVGIGGGLLALTILGLPVLLLCFWLARATAGLDRRRAALVFGEPIENRYRRPADNAVSTRLWTVVKDPQSWKDPVWLAVPVVLAAALLYAVPGSTPAWPQGASTAERVVLCAGCHGEDGNSRLPQVPSLAGQPEFFLVSQLFLFREGVRNVPGMSELLKGLKDDDLVALAGHFAALEPKASEETIDPALVKRGAALVEPMRCASCHLPSFAGQDQMPRLAKQRIDYLIHSLKQFRDNKRTGADTLKVRWPRPAVATSS